MNYHKLYEQWNSFSDRNKGFNKLKGMVFKNSDGVEVMFHPDGDHFVNSNDEPVELSWNVVMKEFEPWPLLSLEENWDELLSDYEVLYPWQSFGDDFVSEVLQFNYGFRSNLNYYSWRVGQPGTPPRKLTNHPDTIGEKRDGSTFLWFYTPPEIKGYNPNEIIYFDGDLRSIKAPAYSTPHRINRDFVKSADQWQSVGDVNNRHIRNPMTEEEEVILQTLLKSPKVQMAQRYLKIFKDILK